MINNISFKDSTDLVIINARALIGRKFCDNVSIYIRGKSIYKLFIGKKTTSPREPALDKHSVIDATGSLVFPSLIDLQVNGNKGKLFSDCSTNEQVIDLLKPHRLSGVASVLMTFISPTFDQIHDGIEVLSSSAQTNQNGTLLGFHLEGPLISPERMGIHSADNLKTTLPKSILKELAELACKVPVLITVAPETVQIKLVNELLENNIRVAIGHTNATYEQTRKLLDLGCKLGTHIFNAMEPISGRYPGAAGAILTDDTVYTSFISDNAHLHSASIELIRRSKPKDKLILISDSLAYGVGNLKPVKIGNRYLISKKGKYVSTSQNKSETKLGGTSISLLEAVMNCRQIYNFTDEEALTMASLNVAKYLKLENSIGQIKVGNYANLVIADTSYNIKNIVSAGKVLTD